MCGHNNNYTASHVNSHFIVASSFISMYCERQGLILLILPEPLGLHDVFFFQALIG